MNPTLCPFTMLMSSPWKKSPNVPPSFSFNFLEFLAKIYWANFFPWAKEVKKGGARKTGRPDPRDRVGRPAWSDRPSRVSVADVPDFCPNCSFSTSFFGQKIFREV
jgi:hypothetical protein